MRTQIWRHYQTDSNMYAFHVIERGSGHIRDNKPCQDYATSCCTDDYAIAIIADGHGSERYFRSDSGSRLAAVIAKLILRDFLIATKNMTHLPQGDWQKQVAASIISNWNDLIEQDKTNNPFTEEELSRLSDAERQQVEADMWQFAYGTTLLAIVRTKKCFFGLHIGDGKCVAIDAEGNCSQPISTHFAAASASGHVTRNSVEPSILTGTVASYDNSRG